MLPKVCAWITVITFTKIYWILPMHSNVTIKVGLTLAGPPCICILPQYKILATTKYLLNASVCVMPMSDLQGKPTQMGPCQMISLSMPPTADNEARLYRRYVCINTMLRQRAINERDSYSIQCTQLPDIHQLPSSLNCQSLHQWCI